MFTWQFILREAQSDVTATRFLGDFAGTPIELDYQLLANEALNERDAFICSASEPNAAAWPAGDYAVALYVVNGNQIAFTVELWRADSSGNDVAIIGAQAATQLGPASGAQINTFTITDAGQPAAVVTDRLKLKLFAENTDAAAPHEFSVMCSLSTIQTPIPHKTNLTRTYDGMRRGRVLGKIMRLGERIQDFDKFGIDVR